MPNFDSEDEIMEFAIARELEANQFYLAVAQRVENPQIRKVFEELAEEELEHKAKLELEVMKKGNAIDTTQQPPPLNVSDYVISDTPLLDMDYKDMLMLAIEKEEAAFRLYISLLTQTDNEGVRETLLSLAQQEVKHKMRFETEYDLLLKQG